MNISERVLRETFFSTFQAAIETGGAMSVMASYNEIDGVPSHANRWLLRDVLRGEWGFDGFVVSDYYAIRELAERPELYGHHVAQDGKEAAALAVRAGVNIELPEPDCYNHLVELVREGTLAESELDELVAPMLAYKFQLGLFDDPYVDPATAERIVGSDAHREVALEAARKTITLLKNDDNILPLDAGKMKTIAVIGPNADRVLLGGYSGKPKQFITVLAGIRERVGDKIEVLYHEGCKITLGGPGSRNEMTLSDPEDNRRSIAEAVKVAERADVVVLAIGGNEQTSREGYGSTTWAIGHRSTWSASRTSWSTRSPRPASRSSRSCSTAVRCRFAILAEKAKAILRVLVPRPGIGPGRGGRVVRRRESQRQAADHDPALRRPPAGVLQLPTVGPPRLPVRRRVAALPVRLRTELHDVQVRRRRGWNNQRSAATEKRACWST